jgi:hypothetical protein
MNDDGGIPNEEESMTATTTQQDVELAHRAANGIEVFLLWNDQTDQVTVTVYDVRLASGFELDVDRSRALDAFYHPFAYATREQTGSVGIATPIAA